jgi:hypothetical protein
MSTGVGCAILPTSSSVCIMRLMRGASGCVTFLPAGILARAGARRLPSLCPALAEPHVEALEGAYAHCRAVPRFSLGWLA